MHRERRQRATTEDYAACLALLRNGSKSFHAASRLLPARLRLPVHALYAFCRISDDCVDESGCPAEAVAAMRKRLARIYDGDMLSDPVDLAFASIVDANHLPRELPEALFEGFEWDAEGRRYQTLSDVRAYAVRVAGTVGVMMAVLMGVRSRAALARACDLGVAMQLTNIARDIGEDARAGRLYLPLDWFAAAGIDAELWLRRPVFDARIARFTAQLLDEAARLYRRAETGIAHLPGDCRPAIWGARYIYDGIGGSIAANGHDSVSSRAFVTKQQKLALLARACVSSAVRRASGSEPCLDEAAFVVNIVAAPTEAAAPSGMRIGWLIDLFERLERNDRYGEVERGGEVRA
ncbi:MAG: phytoene/squalene synthase family protein [Beijerinckiaceae bacterium]|nr:phytoene/squalene synthase family protein [Beijerinckiaceae bacterium]